MTKGVSLRLKQDVSSILTGTSGDMLAGGETGGSTISPHEIGAKVSAGWGGEERSEMVASE